MLAGAETLTRHTERLRLLPVALTSLRATALRSLALAATGSVALFGGVALGGARDDLAHGINAYTSEYVSGAHIWLLNPHDIQATDDFLPDDHAAQIARLSGVAEVYAFQGSFLDIGNRRVWIIGWPRDAPLPLFGGQVTAGTEAAAIARLREGGWVTLSHQIASEHRVVPGDTFTLPTPTGNLGFRVAATTTNLGWLAGTIVLNAADYERAWRTSAPTALGVEPAPGASLTAVRSAIARTLGPTSGSEVLSGKAREAHNDATVSEGTKQLAQISTLLIIAAILAMAAALGSAIWQQRTSLAGLRLEGATAARLRLLLLLEAALLLGAGCLTGVILGIYGELVSDSYLAHVTGFPVTRLAAIRHPFEVLALVVLVALLIVAVPAWFASQVSPTLALESE